MTKVGNLFLIIVAVVLALYAGAKGYLYYKAQDIFKNIHTQTMPFGNLSYGGISTALPGTLIYEDVNFTVPAGSEAITIKSLTLETPKLSYFFKTLSSKGDQARLPDQFKASVEGMEIDLNGPMMKSVDQFFAKALPENYAGELICDKTFLGPAQYRTLGYKRLQLDFSAEYYFYESDFSLITALKFDIADVANGAISMHIKNTLRPEQMKSRSGVTPPTFSKIEFNFEDAGYTERINQHCASLRGISVDDYILAVANQSDDYYLEHWGFVPGNGLRWAYRAFLTNPGKTRIVVKPPEPLDIRGVMHYAPRDLPEILGLSVEVNGQSVNDLTILAIAKPGEGAPTVEEPKSQPEQDGWRVAADKAYKAESNHHEASIDPDYRQVELGSLKNHVGKKIRIILDKGGIREGWLAAVTDPFLKIEQRLHNGTISMLVEVKHINHIEVLSTN
jgi:hypothetical protein